MTISQVFTQFYKRIMTESECGRSTGMPQDVDQRLWVLQDDGTTDPPEGLFSLTEPDVETGGRDSPTQDTTPYLGHWTDVQIRVEGFASPVNSLRLARAVADFISMHLPPEVSLTSFQEEDGLMVMGLTLENLDELERVNRGEPRGVNDGEGPPF